MNKPNYFPLVMKATALISGLLTLILGLCQLHWASPALLATAISLGTVCYHFSMRLLVGFLVPRLVPDPGASWFQQKPWEKQLYRTLHVKQWKGKMPTYDPDAFSLEQHSFQEILLTGCQSELVHEVIVPFSFLPLTFALIWGEFPVFLITSVMGAVYDCAFVIIQRYNRPRLARLAAKESKRL